MKQFTAPFHSIGRSSPEPQPVPGYNLACPSETDLTDCLYRAFGAEAGSRTWSQVRGAVCEHPGRPLSLEQLQRVAEVLEAQGGIAGNIAMAFGIRLRSYLLLSGMRISPSNRGN